ncbi:hypothetical protein [Pyrobaculum sp.]|uniref:hypothetical protein n=1 Tax=Pyrobaculum sp. TaxID=2004705 RepID=UPI003D121456
MEWLGVVMGVVAGVVWTFLMLTVYKHLYMPTLGMRYIALMAVLMGTVMGLVFAVARWG